MGKKIEREAINEQEIIASFLQDEPADHNALLPAVPQPEPTAPESPPAPVRDESRRRRGREQGYEALFIRPSSVTARTGKMVYIRTEFHDTIQRITQVIGGGSLSLSAFIDNVLAHHFDTYREEIERLYESKHTGVFTKKGK